MQLTLHDSELHHRPECLELTDVSARSIHRRWRDRIRVQCLGLFETEQPRKCHIEDGVGHLFDDADHFGLLCARTRDKSSNLRSATVGTPKILTPLSFFGIPTCL